MDDKLLARLRELCADPGDLTPRGPRQRPSPGRGGRSPERDDDDVDGAPWARRGRGRDHGQDRKLRQLCGAVARAVGLALGASSNPLLNACWVEEVAPAPDASRLRVRVGTLDGVDLSAFQEALRSAAPWLRSEVAHAVQRKKTPLLLMEWAGPLGP